MITSSSDNKYTGQEERIRQILNEMIYWDDHGYSGTLQAMDDGMRRIKLIITDAIVDYKRQVDSTPKRSEKG